MDGMGMRYGREELNEMGRRGLWMRWMGMGR